MPTDPAILAQLQTLWGEASVKPPSEATAEPTANREVSKESGKWDASIAELLEWFQAHRDQLPVEPFDLKPGGGVRVSEPQKWYRSLDRDIAQGPTGPRGRLGGLADDLKSLRAVIRG